jgi:hypothetical protein
MDPPISQFLGAFAKFRKGNISFVMSICPAVRLPACLPLLLSFYTEQFGGFSLNLVLSVFRKPVEKIQLLLNLTRITGTLPGDLTYLLHGAESLLRSCPPPVPILSQLHPVPTTPSNFLKIHLNIILRPTYINDNIFPTCS